MGKKDTSKIFYVRNIKGKERLAISLLVSRGGVYNHETAQHIENNPNVVLYIGNQNKIMWCDNHDKRQLWFVEQFGEELEIPERECVLSWDDLKNTTGFYITGTTQVDPKGKPCPYSFASKEQAESAKAYAKISQVRMLGGEVYGEIVPRGSDAYILKWDATGKRVTASNGWPHAGGVLRFFSFNQAMLFYANNTEDVHKYISQ